MAFADTLAVAAAVGVLVGGFGGFLAPFASLVDSIDNAQRGAFIGAYLTTLVGAIYAARGIG